MFLELPDLKPRNPYMSLALDEAHEQGRIEPGDLVLMCGFGAGLTWGTGLFRW